MAQTITRLYDTNKQIASIEADLKKDSFKYNVVTNVQSGKVASVDDIVAALVRAYVPRGEARTYAELVKKGGVVVAALAEFGFAAKLEAILDRYSPNKISVPASAAREVGISDATPFSDILHAPVLLDTSGPYKSYSGDLVLTDSNKFFSGTPLLTNTSGPYQSFSGTPLLLDGKGPYKSFSGTPLLLDTKGPYKSYSGEPLLLNNPTPLSSWLGLPVLSKA
jgi:hypothetical protein